MSDPNPLVDQTYARAAAATGKTVQQLREMAESVFASMLHHAMNAVDPVWTIADIQNGCLYVEVDVPPRLRRQAAGELRKEHHEDTKPAKQVSPAPSCPSSLRGDPSVAPEPRSQP